MPKFVATIASMRSRVAVAAALLLAVPITWALDDAERTLFETRTAVPQPSPALAAALELDIPEWHKPGARAAAVKLGPANARASAQAALDALQALRPDVAQNDFDRAWLAYAEASALRDLGRSDEAIARFNQLLGMPRTMVQDRYTLAALNALGDQRRPGWCDPKALRQAEALRPPRYPSLAAQYAVEGWVRPIGDIAPDGSVEFVVIESSSMRVFEPAATEWMRGLRYTTIDGRPPGRPCFLRTAMHFELTGGKARFSSDLIPIDEWNFNYQSIGASRRVRAAAIEALQRGEPEPAMPPLPR